MKTLSKITLWTGLPLVILLFSYLFSTYSESTISNSVWYAFEPEENFTLEGSDNFIDDRKTLEYYTNIPNFLKETGQSENSLGIKVSWDRRGSHFVDIVPETNRSVQRRVFEAGLWAWGGNYRHELAIIFSRPDGFSYGISMGDFAYYGWRHLKVGLPAFVSTQSRYLDGTDFFNFQSFRIYTNPVERVNDIYIFLDEFNVQEETLFEIYDGQDIAKLIQETRNAEDGGGNGSSGNSDADDAEESSDDPASSDQ